LVRAVLDGAGVKVYLQRDNLGRRMREHRLMVVSYRLKENLGSKKQLATPIVFSPTPLDGDISTRFPPPRRTEAPCAVLRIRFISKRNQPHVRRQR
jgi:hypothetical protein